MFRRRTDLSTLAAITILVISIQSSWVLALARNGFGGACSSRQRCIANSQLTCLENVCNCTKPNDMVYHEESSKCLVRGGEQCKYALEIDEKESQEDTFSQDNVNDYDESNSDSNEDSHVLFFSRRERQPSRRRGKASPRIRYEVLDCVPSSTCNSKGICSCRGGYYPDPISGLCMPLKGYNTTCDLDVECQSSDGLVCWEGFCGCNPNVSTVNKKLGRCLGLPGEKCLNGRCNENSHCSGDICACKKYDILNVTTKSCAKSHGTSCSKSSECSYPLECVTGKCKCRNYHHQVFDGSTNKCLSPVASPCESDTDCVVNSKCGAGRKCECADGHMEFGSGFCRKAFGTNCTSSDDSSPSKRYSVESTSVFLLTTIRIQSPLEIRINEGSQGGEILLYDKCDDQRNLYCRDETCQCETDMEIFSKRQEKCVGLVGSFCYGGKFDCVDDADCSKNGRLPGIGRCACKPGWDENVVKTCQKITSSTTTTSRPSLFEPRVSDDSVLFEDFVETHEDF